MRQDGLMRYLLIYIFVIQMGIVGYLWSDASFYLLCGVNALALGIGAWSFTSSTKNNKNHTETTTHHEDNSSTQTNTATERKADLFVSETSQEKDERYQLHEDEILTPSKETEPSSSQSNIEHVKMRFNKVNRKPQSQKQEGGLARFISFLIALIGFGGIMLIMRESFDFIAMGLGAALMALFLLVVYKAMNIWKKSIFSNIYFLFFAIILGGSIIGIFTSDHNSTKLTIKDQISTFFAGINGDVVEEETSEELTGYLYEITGNVLSGNISTGSSMSGEISLTGTASLQTGTLQLTTGNAQLTTETPQLTTGTTQTPSTTQLTGTTQTTETPQAAQSENTVQTNNSEKVTLLAAIKHLVKTYNLPLSTAKNAQFTHVAYNSPDYPYMKTALEKKMIGTTNDPQATISCDVYMVMKGYALKWPAKANTKEAYWAVAVSKGALNGCVQGAKLTYANL